MLNYSIMRLDEVHLEEYCTDIENQVKNGIATMPLFCMTLTPEGDPAIDKAEALCRVYETYKARLDARGVPSGVLIQASIGHGWQLNALSAFQKYEGLVGGTVNDVCCPADKGFQAYIRAAAARIAACHPAHIMLDDDFRLMMRSGKGCACPLHLKEFNQRAGTSLTREMLYEALCREDADATRYRTIFIETQIDSLVACAREIRAGIDAVDPTIPGSYCACGNGAEGAYEIAAVMAGAGNPVVVRLNNANYCVRETRKFAHIMHRAATQIAALRGEADVILAETDTCPQNRYSTSAASLHAHFTFSILEGAGGAKHWITRGPYEPDSGRAYRKKLAANSGFYHALCELREGLTWTGCRIPIPTEPQHRLTPQDEKKRGDGWYAHVLDRFGLPMHFSNTGEGVCFFDGRRDLCFTDEELLQFLAGKVVLDGEAAQGFIARGFGKYLGVNVTEREADAPCVAGEILYGVGESSAQHEIREITPISEPVQRYSDAYRLRGGVTREVLFPSVTAFQNELGGTVVVFAGCPTFELRLSGGAFGFLNESRKRQMVQILTDLDALPLYYPEDAEMLCKAARRADGTLVCALLNLGLDPVEELPLVIFRDVKRITRLTSTGTYEPVEFQKNGTRYTLSLTAGVFEPLVLCLE